MHEIRYRAVIRLFNPRTQRWPESHFGWSPDGSRITLGRTACGRATVLACS